ncbi:MAG: T9SS type A sorting domain-containing protein, partial [Balneolaceae bacterium]
ATDAFEYALSIWSAHLRSDVSIRINAVWKEFESGDDGRTTLGGAAPSRVVQLAGIGKPDTWYSIAHLSALSGQPIRDQIEDLNHDINVNMNCGFENWYFGIDGNTPEELVDFVTVVMHEIGHGIGFIGSADGSGDNGAASIGFGTPPIPTIFDRFVVDQESNYLIDPIHYENPSSDLFDALIGKKGGIFFDGDEVNHTLLSEQAERGKLYSPEEYRKGSTYSHVDQDTFTGTLNALMRPRIDRAFAMHTPGPLFCGLLRDMEWPLGEACLPYLTPFASIELDNIDNELFFGVTTVGESLQQTLPIQNNMISDAPLEITAEIDGIEFTFASQSSFVIDPGDQFNLNIQYNPVEKGIQAAILNLHHNGKNLPSPIRLTLKGEALDPDQRVRLSQSYPNPVISAASGATITYAIPDESNVRLDLYTADGRHVQSIVNNRQQSGQYQVNINLNGLSSGIYIYRMIVDQEITSKKL